MWWTFFSIKLCASGNFLLFRSSTLIRLKEFVERYFLGLHEKLNNHNIESILTFIDRTKADEDYTTVIA